MTKENYTVRVKSEFESAHSIRAYIEDPDNPGIYLDEPIHGHSWVVEAFASTPDVNVRTGFGIDFISFKKIVENLANYLDHKFINELPPFDDINPSTENIAKWFYDEIIKEFEGNITKIIVWEGPHNFAEYIKFNDA
ncbi:MAG: 6-pyruvoyl trahydropterin synthase family protein [Candidatus Hodarchaeales archaeon]|jgi:6-pyruvoyltetrahydropterin/6-carboxytetrahydropterin synthase